MITDKKVDIRIVSNNINRYKNLGYNCKVGDNININIDELPEKSHVKVNSICDICGKENFISYQSYNKNYSKYNIYTCHSCSLVKNIQTNNKRFGYDHPLKNKTIREKIKQTNIEKCGVENPFQSEKIKEKIKETNLERYGVEYVQQNKEILNKSNNTNIKKYGVNRPSKNKNIYKKIKDTKNKKYGNENYNNIDKIKQTNIEKYGVDNVSKLKDHKLKTQNYYRDKMLVNYDNILNIDYNKDIYYCKCKNGHEYEIRIGLYHNRLSHSINTCTICYPENELNSIKELELLDFIKSNYNGNIIKNDRKILNGKELDIYLPDLYLAFEYNGLYWHSNIYKDDLYHINKIRNCLIKGVQLVYVWEDEWIKENEKTKNNILNILKNKKDIEINSFLISDKILDNYYIVDKIIPSKWIIDGINRIKSNNNNSTYFMDTGKTILKKCTV